jgi:hypothetical protein
VLYVALQHSVAFLSSGQYNEDAFDIRLLNAQDNDCPRLVAFAPQKALP